MALIRRLQSWSKYLLLTQAHQSIRRSCYDSLNGMAWPISSGDELRARCAHVCAAIIRQMHAGFTRRRGLFTHLFAVPRPL